MRRLGLVGLLLLLLTAACTDEVSGSGTAPPVHTTAAPVETTGPPAEPAAQLRFAAVRAEQAQPCASEDATHATDPGTDQCLTLDPVGSFTTRAVAASAMVPTTQTQWVVTIRLDDDAAGRFTTLTTDAAQSLPPRNRIAIVDVERGLLTAPSVMEPITGPEIQITGDFTKDEAEELATRLGG